MTGALTREKIARAIYDVANRWIAPNFPKGHKLRTFDDIDGQDLALHLDYADAVLALVPDAAQAAPDSAIDVLREIVEYETKSAIELEALTGDEMPELPWMAKAKAVLAAQPPAAPCNAAGNRYASPEEAERAINGAYALADRLSGKAAAPVETEAGCGQAVIEPWRDDDLVECLRNPLWAHSNAPFESPQLEQEENIAAMNEAAVEIERLRSEVDRMRGDLRQSRELCTKFEAAVGEDVATILELRSRLAAHPHSSAATEDALGYATRLLEHFVAEHFPHNPDWKPLPDIVGVLTQIDNAITIARDYKEKLRAYEGPHKGADLIDRITTRSAAK